MVVYPTMLLHNFGCSLLVQVGVSIHPIDLPAETSTSLNPIMQGSPTPTFPMLRDGLMQIMHTLEHHYLLLHGASLLSQEEDSLSSLTRQGTQKTRTTYQVLHLSVASTRNHY